ncbi:cytochrome P450 [Culex quinquefasciatus]|uniref:Cytochrome P450 n=1 Tax=Culex quinquefasciatus TaxID=7176 RepID=B0WTS8_CULQU|nr:cytochrome P450 [Culex quinquefasciatus]|eukprot:XP_001855596.1 cytochrome P450 [Culex quinquefasciatus]
MPYNKIPGPSVTMMLSGILFQGQTKDLSIMDMHRIMRDSYGDLVRVPGVLGRKDTLMSFSPDDYEKLFRTEGQWPNRRGMDTFVYYRNKVRPDVFKGMGGLVNEQGESWQRFRTIVNPVMMQPKTIRLYVDKLDEVAREFMEVIHNLRDEKNEMPGDFHHWLNRWALETIGVLALDTRFGCLEKEFKRFSIVMSKVDEAIIRMENNPTQSSDSQSVLEKLLKVDRHVAVVMAFDMLMAGVDTTTSATTSILYCLAKNPDKQAKLRDELRTILPKQDSPLTPQNMRNLPYLRACIKEGLRLYSPIAGNIRAAGKDLVLQGYQVPKGTDVALASIIMYHEDKHFPRGGEFLPERWLKDEPESTGCPSANQTHPFLFLPFGFGPRACIGLRMANLEMELLVARITRRFKYRWNYEELKLVSSLVNILEN